MFAGIRSRFVLVTLAIVLGVTTGATNAQSTKSVINAATNPAYPPLEYKDTASNQLVGFDIDLFNAVAAKMGARVNWIETGWEQLFPSLKTKRADVIVAGITDVPERRDVASFVDYLNDGALFVTLRGNAARLPDMSALCGARVANRRTSQWTIPLTQWSDEHCKKVGKPGIVLVAADSSSDARLQLKQGRVDAAVQVGSGFSYQNSLEENTYQVVGKPFAFQRMGIAFSKDDPQLGQSIKKALVEVMADGTYQKLLHKWGLPESASQQPSINDQP